MENSQVAVYLAYSTPHRHTAIDRELYVPRSWTDAPDRCRAADIPDTRTFATKPHLGKQQVDLSGASRCVIHQGLTGDSRLKRNGVEG
ncbi:transposase [Streptomyces sp. NPDC056333]|uniref:transposase n=1 Tax=Streptomyces sp. NPDC056333 TaxID=3345786 RepID=UPI0035DBC2B2